MPYFICRTCGTQFSFSTTPFAACAICEDERQYVPASGQAWTTLEALQSTHWNGFRRYEPGLLAVGTFPQFAIGQRAFVVQSEDGNLLWDCLSLIDDATVDLINGIGGLAAIAISHPHYYSTAVEWSRAFGDIPVWLHAADREWVMRTDRCYAFWEGDAQPIAAGMTLVRGGGHFAGGTMLHWAAGAGGRGVLLSGDIVQVVPDRRSVSFMRSYPNLIPLSAAAVHGIEARLAPFGFEAVYGAFWGREILRDGKREVMRSAARYVAELGRGDGMH
jgi:hypothetical protein